MPTLREHLTNKTWLKTANKFHKQRLAYAKKRQPLIVKWRWVKKQVLGLLTEPRG